MNRRDFTLAALSGAKGQTLTPVQLQKLLFLLDRNITQHVGPSGFDFQPYHYGPFDQKVYATLDGLEREGLAQILETGSASRRIYALTEAGQRAGEQIAARFGARVSEYIDAVCNFVLTQSFASLVSSVYKAYPEMKVNSVFQE